MYQEGSVPLLTYMNTHRDSGETMNHIAAPNSPARLLVRMAQPKHTELARRLGR